jgi:small subunit ribosomal protein S1
LLKENSFGTIGDASEHPMAMLLDDSYEVDIPTAGEIRDGEVVDYNGKEILVDIGAKSEGLIVVDEVESLDDAARDILAVGNTVRVMVVSIEDRNGNIILSYVKALQEQDWIMAAELLESQEVFQGKAVGYNRGGLLVKLGQVRGFVPASQLGNRRRSRAGRGDNEERLAGLVGADITAKVIEVDRGRNRLILSERAAMKEIRAAQREKILAQIEVGETRPGHIVNLADFGAFVDIGGVEGLVHLSELSWKRVDHPSEVLNVGDDVEVYVLNVDQERNRVGLSLKRLQPDPWTIIRSVYSEGELIEATITNLTRYGAFARLNDDYALEGLIHVSEMADEHVEHPHDIVRKGQVVAARIIRIDPDQRQLGLSLKQVASPKYLEADLATATDVELESE